MKQVFWATLMVLGIFLVSYNNPVFAAETKRVCVEQTDPKTKKPKQVCKDVKVHKKLEGTTVPDKKAK
jgi:hypothetical protein